MPHIKIWIHAVWTTKNRKPLLTKNIRYQVFQHMRENAIKKNIYLDFINGHIEHVHCLISLGTDQTISKTIGLLKGESSYWINKNKMTQAKFEWQADYFAISVSESIVDRVRTYIKNQEQHHRTKTFQEEYDEFITRYKFEKANLCDFES